MIRAFSNNHKDPFTDPFTELKCECMISPYVQPIVRNCECSISIDPTRAVYVSERPDFSCGYAEAHKDLSKG